MQEMWTVPCEFCGKAIDPNSKEVYHKIEGWDRPRKGGGTHLVTLKVDLPQYACGVCIMLRRRNINDEQGALW